MESLKLALKKSVSAFIKSAGLYVTVIVIFSYHVLFEKDFTCTCKGQTADCWIYMFLPAVLIILLLLWIDRTFQRVWRYTASKYRSTFCYLLFYRGFAAAFIGSLWIVSVLLDGDWYVCCFPDERQPQLACENKNNLTDEDQEIIAELKNKSRVSF